MIDFSSDSKMVPELATTDQQETIQKVPVLYFLDVLFDCTVKAGNVASVWRNWCHLVWCLVTVEQS